MTEYVAEDAHPLDASELDAVRWRLEREPDRPFPPQLAQRLVDTLAAERAGWFGALLAKYMRHVKACEGVSFLDDVGSVYSDVEFNEAELAELRAVECHINEENDDG